MANKAKPISLHPLTFHEASKALVKAEAEQKQLKTKKKETPQLENITATSFGRFLDRSRRERQRDRYHSS
jgi:hypothetical protein